MPKKKVFQFELICSILDHYAAGLAGMTLQVFFQAYFAAKKKRLL